MNKAISFNRIARYEGNVPRYTSYPTAVQFSDAVNSKDYTKWLQALSVEEPVSLYLHVPFCDELCRYCACNTLVMRREEAREAYGDLLIEELKRLTATLKTRRTVNFRQRQCQKLCLLFGKVFLCQKMLKYPLNWILVIFH